MRNRLKDRKLPLAVFLLALLLFILSMAGNNSDGDTEKIARRTGKKIERRLELLDKYINKALAKSIDEQIRLEGLPEDMVIYRYVNDSLQSWSNQFSVINDDISTRHVIQRLTNLKNRIVSPLSGITTDLSYLALGPKWYLVKAVHGESNEKILAGIEIKNTLIDDVRRNDNGVNPKFKLSGRYSVLPLNHSGGSAVTIYGTPLFKIICDTGAIAPFFDNSFLRWLGLLLFAAATVIFLAGHRTIRTYATVVFTLTILFLMSYIWGFQMNGSSEFFSPTVYADGAFFFSLGALILLNTYITLFALCSYLAKDSILTKIRSEKTKRKTGLIIYCASKLLAALVIIIYIHTTLKSLILNSNISMELYRVNSNLIYTIMVYGSYLGLFASILLEIQSASPVIREFSGLRYNMFSIRSTAVAGFLVAIYFTIFAASLGFHKEQDRVMVWANRLAVDRDLGLEIRLRSIEEGIATDQVIASLTELENTGAMILNRIAENYLSRIRQSHGMSVSIFQDRDRASYAYFSNLLRNGTQISDGSRFMFVTDGNGHFKYVGSFLYYSPSNGLMRMILQIEPNSNHDDKGYFSIMGRFNKPGDISIPSNYSYAKYSNERLTSYKGNYSYPTIFRAEENGIRQDESTKVVRMNDYTHFIHRVSDNEIIIISRPQRNALVFFTSMSYLFLIFMGILHMIGKLRERRKGFKSNYFKTRINTILFTSSTLILASLTVVSILFVYKRNEENMRNLMTSKISTIQTLIESQVRGAKDYTAFSSPGVKAAVENVSNTTKSDITLYTPSGKVFHTTNPEVFEKMVIGNRMNQDAFHNICYLNDRFFINREKIADIGYWALYAPVFNDNRELLAIVSTPYTDRDYDFRREAFFHAALMINLFLILLIIALLFSTREVNIMFSPLIEMGKKMNTTDIDNLEYIIYKREDEISSLVDAYNRMVKVLSDSTRQLAMAERDKAWSQMARQVAHEIKNPLTPIKLEIQRLIRLKHNGNPRWEEKFDKVADVILEHIDILTDTANEFSTFAKLYTEEPVLLDLDKALKDQILIFDNRENIHIQYIGMENAYVMAPKPQLIRVFVNLITNAIQAVEIMQKEAMDKDGTIIEGRVLICLRNSIRDGYYDIVFDDNGPGVKEENRSRLFTPNFTTKSGGTGLGLAICRNIIEKCDGEITYQRSFSLGGASFTVTFPKDSTTQRT